MLDQPISEQPISEQPTTQVTTQFVTAEIALQETAIAMHQAIEVELQQWGEPLRWAVVAVDAIRQTAQVEAIVIQGMPLA